MQVPWPQPAFGRYVYPGFLQLSGFMSMNLDKHMTAHKDFYKNLVKNDGESTEKHREFYDEYLAVMDLTAEFYLQTVETVFQLHSLPNGTFVHRGKVVDLGAIRDFKLTSWRYLHRPPKLVPRALRKLAIARDDDIVQACLVCEGGQNLRKK